MGGYEETPVDTSPASAGLIFLGWTKYNYKMFFKIIIYLVIISTSEHPQKFCKLHQTNIFAIVLASLFIAVA